jgi:putative ABC transport system permease protein
VAVERWVGNVVTADLVVRASTGLGPTAVRLPASTQDVITGVAGVAAVVSYRNERIRYGGKDVALVVVDGRSLRGRSGHELIAGDPEAFTTALPEGGACVVSDNFARRFGVGVGDAVTLESPTGALSFPVAAVIVNFISDRGTILIDQSVFVEHWKNDQVDAFHVSIAPGADVARVRNDLRAALASAGPALISTRTEFVEEVREALDAFQVLITAVVMMALVIALMGVMTSLWVSAVERTRDIGILKALGAGHHQIAGAVVWEALGLVAGSLALGLPLGSLLSWFLRARVSEHYAGFRFPAAYPVDTLLVVLVALPVVAVVGASLPARWAAGLKVAEAISYE